MGRRPVLIVVLVGSALVLLAGWSGSPVAAPGPITLAAVAATLSESPSDTSPDTSSDSSSDTVAVLVDPPPDTDAGPVEPTSTGGPGAPGPGGPGGRDEVADPPPAAPLPSPTAPVTTPGPTTAASPEAGPGRGGPVPPGGNEPPAGSAAGAPAGSAATDGAAPAIDPAAVLGVSTLTTSGELPGVHVGSTRVPAAAVTVGGQGVLLAGIVVALVASVAAGALMAHSRRGWTHRLPGPPRRPG
ncbi:MAG: hypothetical protein ACFCVF_16315 [Kineosporiaceae bacterium]